LKTPEEIPCASEAEKSFAQSVMTQAMAVVRRQLSQVRLHAATELGPQRRFVVSCGEECSYKGGEVGSEARLVTVSFVVIRRPVEPVPTS
jgi:hypothetical protein